MFSPALIIPFLAYLIFLLGFVVFSAFGIYHLIEYGHVGDFSRTMIYVYVGTAAAIMLITLVMLIVTAV